MKRRTILLAGMIALAGTPSTALASLEFNSSMSARCVATAGDPCTLVEFTLNIADYQSVGANTYSDVWVNDVSVATHNASQWAFNEVVRVWDDVADLYNPTTGMDDWTVDYRTAGGLKIKANTGGGVEAIAPVYLLVQMDVFSTPDKFSAMTYAAGGYAYEINGADYPVGADYSTSGTVTPEPVSLVLMGSGLMGVAAARRRRRQAEIGPV